MGQLQGGVYCSEPSFLVLFCRAEHFYQAIFTYPNLKIESDFHLEEFLCHVSIFGCTIDVMKFDVDFTWTEGTLSYLHRFGALITQILH